MEESREALIKSLEAEDRALYELHKQRHRSLRRHAYFGTEHDSRVDSDLAAVRTVRSILRMRDTGEMPIAPLNATGDSHVPHGAMPSTAAQCITPTGSYGHVPSRKGTIHPVVVKSPEVPRPSLTLASCSDAASDTSYPPTYEAETKGSRAELLEDSVVATLPTPLGALTILQSDLHDDSGKSSEADSRGYMSAAMSSRGDVSVRSAYTPVSALEGTLSHLDDDLSDDCVPDSPQSVVSSQLQSGRAYTLDASPVFHEVDSSTSSKASFNADKTVNISVENEDVGEPITFSHRAVSRAEGPPLVTEPYPSDANPRSAYATTEADMLCDDMESVISRMSHSEDGVNETSIEDYAAVNVGGAAAFPVTNDRLGSRGDTTSFDNEVPMMTFMTDVDIGGLTPMESDSASESGDVCRRSSNVSDNLTPIQSHFESFDARMPMYSNMESKNADLSESPYSDSSHSAVIEPPLLPSSSQQPEDVTATVSTMGVSTNVPEESPVSKVASSTDSSPITITTITATGDKEDDATTAPGITITPDMAAPDEGAGATFTEHPLSDTVVSSLSISDGDLKEVETPSIRDESPANSMDGSTSYTAVGVSAVEASNSASVNDAFTGEHTIPSTVDTGRSNITVIADTNTCPDVTSAGMDHQNSVDSPPSPGVQPPEGNADDLSIANDATIGPPDDSIHNDVIANDDNTTQGTVGAVGAISIKSSSISPLSEKPSSTADTVDIRSVSRAFTLSSMGDSSEPSTSCPPDENDSAACTAVDSSGKASIDSTIATTEPPADASSSHVVAPIRSDSILENPNEVPIDVDISHDFTSDEINSVDLLPTRGDAALGEARGYISFSAPGIRSSRASSDFATAVGRLYSEEMAGVPIVVDRAVSQSMSSITTSFEEVTAVGSHDDEAPMETAPSGVYGAAPHSDETVIVEDSIVPGNGSPTLTMIPSSPEDDGYGIHLPSARSSTEFAADTACSENLSNTIVSTDAVPFERPRSTRDASSGTPSSFAAGESISNGAASEDAFSTDEERDGTPVSSDQTSSSAISEMMATTYANSLTKRRSTSNVSSDDSSSRVANEDGAGLESRSSSSDSDDAGASESTWNDNTAADTPDEDVGASFNSMSTEENDGDAQSGGVSTYTSYLMNFF